MGWDDRLRAILEILDVDPELILKGNSIFTSLEKENRKEVRIKYLGQYREVNMGRGGDRTENEIWRL